ncbi:MAG: Gfo/Idh/MocA family oxidoreductase [Clostridia bacterium]|nr:Gfo/Idh/MocA family oxidoreductase [Clostridia bacterium]
MKDLNIAVIGWGFMGRMHTYALRALPLMYRDLDFRPRLKLLASGRIENARAGMNEAGFEECTSDWREILERKDIDVVSVCTPNGLHEEMVISLIKAGKHIYVDKPLTTTLESAGRIRDAAKASDVKIALVMNNRFLPATIRAFELVREGRIGDITGFNARYLHSGSIDPSKPIGWKQTGQGGVILDLASHALDLLCNLVGYPAQVYCMTNTLYPERPTKQGTLCTDISEDHAVMTLRLASGAVGFCEASKIATGTNDELTFEVCGTKGALRFDLMEPGWLWFFNNTLPEAPYGGERGFKRIECLGRYPFPSGSFPPPKNAVGWERGHIHSYYSFLDCVAHDKQPLCGIEDAYRLAALMEAARFSAQTGKLFYPDYD